MTSWTARRFLLALTLLGTLACGRVADSDGVADVLPDLDGSVASLGALLHEPSVWIGEVETTVTYPDASMQFVFTPSQPPPPPSPKQKVVLILDALADGVTGTVTFGEGPPPALPEDLNEPYVPSAPNMLGPLLTSDPIAGFEYSLVYSKLRGAHLSIAFLGGEVMRDWCARQPPHPGDIRLPGTSGQPICTCTDTECKVSQHGRVRRIDLVINGDIIEGELSGTVFDPTTRRESPAIRLQRVE